MPFYAKADFGTRAIRKQEFPAEQGVIPWTGSSCVA
jgi:hypothetical protein